jgi:putative membrane protein
MSPFRWRRRRSWPDVVAGGMVVGFCATEALDWLSSVLYQREDHRTRHAEDATRGHRHAYEVAVERLAGQLGRPLDRDQVARWGWRFHKLFGFLGGPAYLLLRRAFPRLTWGSGLAFGAAFFLVVDELLVPVLRLTPGPLAFSWKVHARGAAAHLAYGVAAESTARLLAARA